MPGSTAGRSARARGACRGRDAARPLSRRRRPRRARALAQLLDERAHARPPALEIAVSLDPARRARPRAEPSLALPIYGAIRRAADCGTSSQKGDFYVGTFSQAHGILFVLAIALVGVFAVTGASAGSGGGTRSLGYADRHATADQRRIAESGRHDTEGGASRPGDDAHRPHWHGSTTDPNNGVTYGYNMVGADPNNCSGSACSTDGSGGHHTADREHRRPDVRRHARCCRQRWRRRSSPTNDYGSTPAATAAGAFPNSPAFIRGPGGACRKVTRASLQLRGRDNARAVQQDGSRSTYHLILNPNIVHAR